ncbi:MAG: GntR family transcriptional regulator [Hungatella sp.]|nr:GntR family transcriptional regulator [Hungatella sp.]
MYITEQLARENGRDYALRILKDNIIRLEMEPGSSISDREVAAKLSLSRTPVREALLELAKAKVVEIYPQRGSVVSLIDYDLVEEAYFVRSVLETAVVELACERANEDSLAELESNVKLQKFYQQDLVVEKLMELDDEFHRLLFKMTGKLQAYEMMKGMMVHFDRVRNLALGTMKDKSLVEEHEKILTAVGERDPGAARKVMTIHLSRYQVDEEEVRRRYPGYFKQG